MQLLKTTLEIQSRDLAINSNVYAKTLNFLKDLTYESYHLDWFNLFFSEFDLHRISCYFSSVIDITFSLGSRVNCLIMAYKYRYKYSLVIIRDVTRSWIPANCTRWKRPYNRLKLLWNSKTWGNFDGAVKWKTLLTIKKDCHSKLFLIATPG